MTTKALFSGCVLVTLAVFTAAGREQAPPAASQSRSTVGLADFISAATRDTNADGFPDVVVARIVVPATAAREDVAAASNIAARLGFETMALTLPIVARDSELARPAEIALPIIIGRRNHFLRKLVDAGTLDIGEPPVADKSIGVAVGGILCIEVRAERPGIDEPALHRRQFRARSSCRHWSAAGGRRSP